MPANKQRCAWADTINDLMHQYHDTEWGRPSHDNRHLFELLSLEIMQAGLSWQTVLNKRAAFKAAFADFDYQQVAQMTPQVPLLLKNDQIIRNRMKVTAMIKNANAVAQLVANGMDFDHYVWNFVSNQPIQHHIERHEQVPNTTDLAKRMSKQMKKDGFAFTGPVVVYSFMQAAGLVNDHEIGCFVYQQLEQ
ncbi:DNA-3-methyladenine glycosylase I [Lacticaseibacillus rhamnosus]|uniref:DNA-3-methyladenine glycosylase I n=1 Tax=Lacticaseibacillus rhamnosus TaxID=47715 RepID=UPI0024B069EB|nr:DNA-3-methyladenine glycosylase I [Lacticaseibacillus rhamnosus]WHM90203.1 DNA-3-methyladenine glycosylase I [Lacticaseibacillus rhamnosus]